MKDAFGRDIKTGDVVVYATRYGSTQNLNVAIVKEVVNKPDKWSGVDKEFLRAECVAGTGTDFRLGKWNHDRARMEPYVSRRVSLSANRNMMIVNGIDVDLVKNLVQSKQQDNVKLTNRKR